MESTGIVLLSLLAVVLSSFLARLLGWPLPLVQIGLGALVAQLGLPVVRLEPEVFFLLFLPPLLFIDGWRIPKDALRRDAGVVLTLALGLVLFTVLGMRFAVAAALTGQFSAGTALGSVVRLALGGATIGVGGTWRWGGSRPGRCKASGRTAARRS